MTGSQKTKLAQGGPSDQMVLLMARQNQIHSRKSWKKKLQEAKGPSQKEHSVSLKKGPLTHSQGKTKKRDNADDEDDAVRTN